MTASEQRRELAVNFENDLVSLGAAEQVTVYAGSGTDTYAGGVYTRYLNLSSGVSFGIEVMPTVACSVTKINDKPLKSPMSVGTGGWRAINGRFTSITILAGSATIIEIFGKE